LKLSADERTLMYVAGHNVVIYDMEEKTQTFVPGTEGSLGINFITENKDKQYLAICEIGEPRAMCTIYDTENDKRKVIPEYDTTLDFKS
jgi:translation elongation factor P/translation initiation factor 5A